VAEHADTERSRAMKDITFRIAGFTGVTSVTDC
jgi:hypothetical protein